MEDYYELGLDSQGSLETRLDRIERRQQTLATMLDQLYLGLVLRLSKVPEEETDVRIELAEDAHEKWVRAVTAIMEGTGPEWLRKLPDRACQMGRL
ncbi:MAG: hypothetical protein GY937_10105 [bacterium]|nr:hypothetical protein [bacterium]